MADPLAVEAQVCLTMSAAARSLVAFYRPLLEPLGLTHPQYLAMLALWQYGPISLNELAGHLHLEPATASPLVRRLEAMGLLRRERDRRRRARARSSCSRTPAGRCAARPSTSRRRWSSGSRSTRLRSSRSGEPAELLVAACAAASVAGRRLSARYVARTDVTVGLSAGRDDRPRTLHSRRSRCYLPRQGHETGARALARRSATLPHGGCLQVQTWPGGPRPASAMRGATSAPERSSPCPTLPVSTSRSPSTARAGTPPRGASRTRVPTTSSPPATGATWSHTAQEAVADLVTIEDTFALQSSRFEGPDERTDQVRGRLDAELVAARLAPVTQGIGLVPVVTVTHTEPFHVSKALATLDHTSRGRAGWQVRVSAGASQAELFGRREFPTSSRRSTWTTRNRTARPGDVRRGRRRRRGGPSALGQLGGRRGDPRRGHRSVHRPRQAAPRRLRGRAVLGPRPVDHAPAAAGTARGHGAGALPDPVRAGRAAPPTSCS